MYWKVKYRNAEEDRFNEDDFDTESEANDFAQKCHESGDTEVRIVKMIFTESLVEIEADPDLKYKKGWLFEWHDAGGYLQTRAVKTPKLRDALKTELRDVDPALSIHEFHWAPGKAMELIGDVPPEPGSRPICAGCGEERKPDFHGVGIQHPMTQKMGRLERLRALLHSELRYQLRQCVNA